MTTPSTESGATVAGQHDGLVVATYENYAQAQRAVDFLSDSGFPVEHLRIVGHGLRSVEVVAGRLTKGRAAMAGAASGAWMGLLFGLLLSLFAVGFWLGAILAGLILGAFWGAVLGFVAHASTGGNRDFASTQGLQAERYDVVADPEHAQEATRKLAQM